MACTTCHQGVEPATSMGQAHEGVVGDPSADPEAACGTCHAEIAAAFPTSMHATLQGERNMIAARAGHSMDHDPAMVAGFDASCASCHATCGSCHISRPDAVEGGFVDGHIFDAQPSMVDQCTACHGSRVGEEYRGEHRDEIEGYAGDVHYLSGGRCEMCHGATEMHSAQGEHRYAVDELPRCDDCHDDVATANGYHAMHIDDLSCQVCHSQDYKNCASCHVPNGLDEPSWLGFKIGINPQPDLREPTYVTLRHIPVSADTYAGWGVDEALSGYDTLPTWKYASPHNIRRWTARTEVADGGSCSEACHNTPATVDGWFLRQVDLDAMPDEAAANEAYIVPDTVPTDWD